MSRWRILSALAVTYMLFAVLLDSVGTVILQSIATFGVGKPQASILEACKDLTIAATSLMVASFLPALGFRRSMMLGLSLVAVACLAMPVFPSFRTTALLFVCVGLAFALIKVAVYSSIGLLTTDQASHSRLTNLIEGLFMVGVLCGGWLFSAFIDPAAPANFSWFRVYWLLAGMAIAVLVLVKFSPLDESQARVPAHAAAHAPNAAAEQRLAGMLTLVARPLVYCFLASAFLYVLIEQSFGTWLPTFNREVLLLPNTVSVQMASILAGATALGRIGAGVLLKRIRWHLLLNACVIAMGLLVLLVLPLASHSGRSASLGWSDAPVAAYLIPLIGLLMAPIYPVINSVALSSLPKPLHASMTGLILVFSALGGTLGSRITAIVFSRFDGVHAFYFSLLPMFLLLLTLSLFRRESERASDATVRRVFSSTTA